MLTDELAISSGLASAARREGKPALEGGLCSFQSVTSPDGNN